MLVQVWWLLLAGKASSLPSAQRHLGSKTWQPTWDQDQQKLDHVSAPHGQNKMVLPIFDDEPYQRNREIERKQLGYLYGESLLGNTSYFPSGSLGSSMVQEHQTQWYSDAEWLKNAVYTDAASSAAALEKVTLRAAHQFRTQTDSG